MNFDDFLSLARSRRSIRRFREQTVSREDLLRVLEAARWAPSNHNRQPWRFVVEQDRSRIANLAEAVRRELEQKLKLLPQAASDYANEFAHYATFFAGAPVLMVVLHKRPASFSSLLLEGAGMPELVSGEPLSTAMAVQNLLLAAQALGLGTCMLTAPLVVRGALNRALKPTPGYELTCFVALGYPDEAPPQPRRKSIEHIAEFVQPGSRLESEP